MSLETKLFTLLSTDGSVIALAGSRIYPLEAPQGAAYPFIVYTRISSGREYSMSGYSSLENPRMQIDSYADTYAGVKALNEAVVTAMRGATTFSVASDDPKEFKEDDVFRISTDFSIWHEE